MLKILISGYYGFDNIGDEAILASVIKSLRESANQKIELTVLSGNPEKTEQEFKIKAIPRANLFKIIQALRNADLLVSGGGSLLQDVSSVFSLYYYLMIILLARVLGKKTVLYAQGIGPIKYKFNRLITRIIINGVDLITVRDQESKQELLNMGVSKQPIHVTADSVYALEVPKYAQKKKDEGDFLIGVSVRDWKNLYQYKQIIADSLDYIIAQQNARVVFIPMYYPADYQASLQIKKCMKQEVAIIDKKLNMHEILAEIGKLDLMLGVRLHALIFATLMNVPVIGISYDPKIDNFLQIFKFCAVGSVDHLRRGDILAEIQRIKENSEAIKQRINKEVNYLRKQAVRNAQLTMALFQQKQEDKDEQSNDSGCSG